MLVSSCMAEAAFARSAEVCGGAWYSHRGAMADEKRFREIFGLYDFVWRTLRRFGVQEAGVDDAAQEVFVVVARKLASIEAGQERSFLFGIARRVAADARRARARAMPALERSAQAPAASVQSPEAVTLVHEARALLDQVLNAMSDDERAVFVLFELEELSKSEVARCLGIPEGTVASRFRRAREIFLTHTRALAEVP